MFCNHNAHFIMSVPNDIWKRRLDMKTKHFASTLRTQQWHKTHILHLIPRIVSLWFPNLRLAMRAYLNKAIGDPTAPASCDDLQFALSKK